jgi:hypothetical protein
VQFAQVAPPPFLTTTLPAMVPGLGLEQLIAAKVIDSAAGSRTMFLPSTRQSSLWSASWTAFGRRFQVLDMRGIIAISQREGHLPRSGGRIGTGCHHL